MKAAVPAGKQTKSLPDFLREEAACQNLPGQSYNTQPQLRKASHFLFLVLDLLPRRLVRDIRRLLIQSSMSLGEMSTGQGPLQSQCAQVGSGCWTFA